MSRYRTAPYVYRIYDNDGLIYIGSTNRFWRRLEEHRRDSWWAETVTKVKARVYPSLEEARRVERQAIYDEVPRWNLCELRPRLRFFDRDQWDDYLQRVALAQKLELEVAKRRGWYWPGRGVLFDSYRGLDWLVQRYRFHFGEDYDRTRLVKAA
jgi:predicted GIY-YIG superfamily endonuclease